ncbi:MAG TPA: calcium-binding protein [Solirubrobacterales bacterium]|nr:calcium-binding protein [Solirubrobacterales bacterium]
MRFLPVIVLACLFVALPAAAAEAADTSPACAEGPVTVGDTTYGTPCADTIVAPPGVERVVGGGGDDVIVTPTLSASAPCPEGCHLGVGSQTYEGGEGDDIVFGERGNDILRGGPGNDQLFGGIGDDLLEGGSGNDRLAGGFGADSIDGEEGDDYVRGDSTIDRIFDTGGEADTDILSYSTGVTPGFGGQLQNTYPGFPPPGGERGVELELGATGQNADNGVAADGGGVDEVEVGAFETIVGTPFSDHIVGTSRNETIYGGGGADVLVGGGGTDTIVGGADGDLCEAPGGTTMDCEGVANTRDPGKVTIGFMTPLGAPYPQVYLVGGTGDEQVGVGYGGGGLSASVTFTLAPGEFDKSASEDAGCVIMTPESAYCTFAPPLDSLLLAGMDGSDVLLSPGFPLTTSVVSIGGEGNDSITGGNTEDILVDGPGSGRDVITAFGGDDALIHNGGADELLGGTGNDLFLSNSVCDGEQVVGGEGRDNSSWARFGEGIQADLTVGRAGRPGTAGAPACGGGTPDSLAEIEDLEGTSFGDILYGDAGPNQLLGHPGADVYFAAAGEDSILANSGDADISIACGLDKDSATIDRPQYGDPAPVECEEVFEADPNNFRTRTLLPPPPLPKPPPPPPPVDRRPPRTTLGAHPPATVFTHRTWRRVAFRFASNEAGSSFRCKLDGKPYRPCISPRAYSVKAGRHAFRVYAIDPAGNRDRTPAFFRFRVRKR